ncbi:MAG: hypothetical protein IT365_06070 [Candidatus Hydrogenedentes bacterium]|nr:hypothetical protein [Candidatus Hydrogenedentota bacterium]
MGREFKRRQFLQIAGAGAFMFVAPGVPGWAAGAPAGPELVSPGCRGSNVKVARLYLGVPHAHWPEPTMDLDAEVKRYEAEFAKREKAFADVEFAPSVLVTSREQAQALAPQLADVDGVLAMHLSMGVRGMVEDVLAAGKPTFLYAAPYSGHEWTTFGKLRTEPQGAKFECILTSDFDELAAAVRPFRAIHHLREAKILNVTSRELSGEFLSAVADKFGTQIVRVDRERVLAAYEAVPEADAAAEARRWIRHAVKVVEPARDEIERSCRLALAFERLMDEDKATVITVDCYGSMYRQLPAFPCIGFTRLNDMGLAGICESDLASAMTFILMQSMSGRPGFISDPTVDESKESIILAHCLGSTKMDGPDGKACPYKLRTIMERQEGAVPQVKMEKGRRATQAILVGTDRIQYFTGEIIDAPDTERGCRTKIEVKVDGDIETLWHNWSHGLHRVTCYGDMSRDLERFCRYTGIALVDEASKEGGAVTT